MALNNPFANLGKIEPLYTPASPNKMSQNFTPVNNFSQQPQPIEPSPRIGSGISGGFDFLKTALQNPEIDRAIESLRTSRSSMQPIQQETIQQVNQPQDTKFRDNFMNDLPKISGGKYTKENIAFNLPEVEEIKKNKVITQDQINRLSLTAMSEGETINTDEIMKGLESAGYTVQQDKNPEIGTMGIGDKISGLKDSLGDSVITNNPISRGLLNVAGGFVSGLEDVSSGIAGIATNFGESLGKTILGGGKGEFEKRFDTGKTSDNIFKIAEGGTTALFNTYAPWLSAGLSVAGEAPVSKDVLEGLGTLLQAGGGAVNSIPGLSNFKSSLSEENQQRFDAFVGSTIFGMLAGVKGKRNVLRNPTKENIQTFIQDNLSSKAVINNFVENITNIPVKQVAKQVGKVVDYGLNATTQTTPETRRFAFENPKLLQEAQSKDTNTSLKEIGDLIQKNIEDVNNNKSEIGKAYNIVRQNPINFDNSNIISKIDNFLEGLDIKNTAKGLDFSKSSIGATTDQKAIQKAYDRITGNKDLNGKLVLNLRQALDNIINRKSGVDKSGTRIVKGFRKIVDQEASNKIKGLKDLDNLYGPIAEEANTFQKEFFDKNGNIKPSSIDSLKNITTLKNEGRIARLEEMLPGVTDKLKAIYYADQVKKASELKTGASLRGITGAGAGFSVGGVPGAILGYVATNPATITYLLRKSGEFNKLIRKIEDKVPLTKSDGNDISKVIDTLSKGLEKSREVELAKKVQKELNAKLEAENNKIRLPNKVIAPSPIAPGGLPKERFINSPIPQMKSIREIQANKSKMSNYGPELREFIKNKEGLDNTSSSMSDFVDKQVKEITSLKGDERNSINNHKELLKYMQKEYPNFDTIPDELNNKYMKLWSESAEGMKELGTYQDYQKDIKWMKKIQQLNDADSRGAKVGRNKVVNPEAKKKMQDEIQNKRDRLMQDIEEDYYGNVDRNAGEWGDKFYELEARIRDDSFTNNKGKRTLNPIQTPKPITKPLATKELEPLYQEARKYKSAEEFIKENIFEKEKSGAFNIIKNNKGEAKYYFDKYDDMSGKGKELIIEDIFVKETGKKYGDRIMQELEDIAIKKGVDRISLHAYEQGDVPTNKLRDFYERHGYSVEAGDDSMGYEMIKKYDDTNYSIYETKDKSFKTKSQLKQIREEANKTNNKQPITKDGFIEVYKAVTPGDNKKFSNDYYAFDEESAKQYGNNVTKQKLKVKQIADFTNPNPKISRILLEKSGYPIEFVEKALQQKDSFNNPIYDMLEVPDVIAELKKNGYDSIKFKDFGNSKTNFKRHDTLALLK